MKFILGKKIGMTQIFREDGQVVPVTLIEAGPCPVVQVKTKEKDGYQAVQIGFEAIKGKKVKKPQLKKSFRYLREFSKSDLSVGDKIEVGIFQAGEVVKVSGLSKGRGFQGVVKRHGFKGGRASHGNKHNLRAPGSIGATNEERVWKGRRMGGRMGYERNTVRGLKVVEVDQENNLLAIKGAIPGRKGTLLEIVVIKEKK